MQRVEPSKIQDFEEALLLTEEQPRLRVAAERIDEPLPVEARPVHLPEDSGSALGWGTFFFCVFWLGGISAYLVGLIGWAKLFELPLASP